MNTFNGIAGRCDCPAGQNLRSRRAAFSYAAIAVKAFAVAAVLTFAVAGCSSPRVSYNVRPLYTDPRFTALALSGGEIAALPILTSRGIFAEEGDFEAGAVAEMLRRGRPDLKFVPFEKFEETFPPRFDRRLFGDFYGMVFRGELDSVRGMDTLWRFAGQQYILVFALKDGAIIQNADKSYFKHVGVECELWSRETRMPVWRQACRGVSDDRNVSDGEILEGCLRLLAETLPAAAPTSTGLQPPPGAGRRSGGW